jgi:hypothetical protein
MLDASWPGWEGKVVWLTEENPNQSEHWLSALDQDPSDLHAHLHIHRFTRLGRYAEQLLSWHFRRAGILHAQGVQVREGARTLGEFDFLLEREGRLLHRELATKVYLLRSNQIAQQPKADYFVGPNLADTLGAKISKIIHRQLALSAHPASADVLPSEVHHAGAWVKGWLFYPRADQQVLNAPGLSAHHCRGSWCSLEEFAGGADPARYQLLERLQWLTPQRSLEEGLSRDQALARLQSAFATQSTPVTLAEMKREGGAWIETARVFVVPDSWRQAAQD